MHYQMTLDVDAVRAVEGTRALQKDGVGGNRAVRQGARSQPSRVGSIDRHRPPERPERPIRPQPRRDLIERRRAADMS